MGTFHEYSSGKLHEVTEQVKRELYEAEKIEEIIDVLGAGRILLKTEKGCDSAVAHAHLPHLVTFNRILQFTLIYGII